MKLILEQFEKSYSKYNKLLIAVSGGVDSMTLGYIAHKIFNHTKIYHAISPAVPNEATNRVKAYADKHAWNLVLINAGEFDDVIYVKNPVNRCFYCKTNLYKAISETETGIICSGANLDDLSDYRPGLDAAKSFQVEHPWIKLGINKEKIRHLANYFGLSDIQDLPASPCLSSRVETGIHILPETLALISQCESAIKTMIDVHTVRCRVQKDKITIELDKLTLENLKKIEQINIKSQVNSLFGDNCSIFIDSYKRGSAFLR
jgi:uncharacterized protein